MKRILVIAILLVSFCVLTSSVRAESNPLLTIFEEIQIGDTGTKSQEVINKIFAYQKRGDRITSAIINNWQTPLVISWIWLDSPYNIKALELTQMAELEITISNSNKEFKALGMEARVLSATYTYKFLDLKKSLSK